MITNADQIKLKQLKTLIDDYSYSEKRYAGIVNKMDKLLIWACEHFIAKGESLKKVKDILGETYVIIGYDEDKEIEWLYPCLERSGMQPQVSTQWYLTFVFRKGKLQFFEKKKQLIIN